MVCANSGAGGNPDPTFGRCTIFSILHQSEKKRKLLCVWKGGREREGGERGVCGWVFSLPLVLSRRRWVFFALFLQETVVQS